MSARLYCPEAKELGDKLFALSKELDLIAWQQVERGDFAAHDAMINAISEVSTAIASLDEVERLLIAASEMEHAA